MIFRDGKMVNPAIYNLARNMSLKARRLDEDK